MKNKTEKSVKVMNQGGSTGVVFLVAWVGALVYFVQRAEGFWEIILAFLQSLVWPAFVLYRVLEALAI